jgi:hypothetical protein
MQTKLLTILGTTTIVVVLVAVGLGVRALILPIPSPTPAPPTFATDSLYRTAPKFPSHIIAYNTRSSKPNDCPHQL